MPHVVATRYQLVSEIGRGGMGSVWLGRDLVLDRQVALKRVGLIPGAARADIERVRREARVSAMVNHPNVVAVFDLVEEDERHWLVMEYVESRTLAEMIRSRRGLKPDQVAPIVAQAAHALAHAHAAKIVHRDVKPSNILVTPDGVAKLGDFGIARAASDPTLTETGLVTGSPGYLAPEVAAGHPATPASDVWSLGATVFHAVAGHPPYDTGENLMGTLYKLVHEEPPRTDKAGWLSPLLLATMHRDPKQRWTAKQVAAFLERGPVAGEQSNVMPAPPPALSPTAVLSSVVEATRRIPLIAPATAVMAPPPPPPPPPSSAARRRRTAPLSLAALLLVVLAVTGWLLSRGGGEPPADTTRPPSSKTTTTPPATPRATADGMETFVEDYLATPDGMETFVEDYLATATSNPEAAWRQLTPAFQRASGSFSDYLAWWGQIEKAEPRSIQADPEVLRVSYTVEYTFKKSGNGGDRGRGGGDDDGKGEDKGRDERTRTDDVTLVLVFDGTNYKISAEPS